MQLVERLEKDLVTAMKAHEATRVSILRTLRAAIKNAAIAARTSAKAELEDADVEGVIRTEVKRLRDSLTDFTKAARQDLIDAANTELATLQEYLPKELSPEEMITTVRATIADMKARGVIEFGKIMGAVVKAIGGRADGRAVAEAVKKELA